MNEKRTIASNLIWRFLERFGAQAVNLAVGIVLARRLGPGPAGDIAVLLALVTILRVFADSGMANALVQKKEPDDLDFSSVFLYYLGFSLLLYGLLFLAAPAIARFYGEPVYTPVLRALGLLLPISGFYNVQQAYVAKTLQFKRFFFASLGGTLASGVVSIFLAYRGFGVWALAAQHLSYFGICAGILWFTVNWRPKAAFSFARLRGLLSFGWKLLAASLLDTVYQKVYPLIIGKSFTRAELGQFDKGRNWPDQLSQGVNVSLDAVLLPVLSARQDDRDRVRETTRRAIRTGSYLLMPMMAGLAACARPLVRLLLGEEWLPSVPYLQIFCAICALYPLHTANLNAIKALGRSDLLLRLELRKKGLETLALLLTIPHGILAIALGQLACGLAAQVLNAWPNRRLLGYPYLLQLRDLLPAALLTLAMALPVWALTLLGLPDAVTLPLQVILGAALYLLGSRLFHLESYGELLSVLKSYLPSRRREARD